MSFSNYKKIKTKIKGKPGTYSLWVADTPKKRTKGLSGIRNLPKNTGMIFVYEDDAPRSFTMKNTFVPLQIIFLDKNFNVLRQEIGRPKQPSPVKCSEKCRYVVEIQGKFV